MTCSKAVNCVTNYMFLLCVSVFAARHVNHNAGPFCLVWSQAVPSWGSTSLSHL